MKKINLFVYGSLREGFFNYDKYLAGKVVEKKDAILENMRLYHMPYKGYPAITPGNDKVLGEIMVINEEEYDETVKDMDGMEGFISENNPENEYHKIVLEVKKKNVSYTFIIKIKIKFLIVNQYIFQMEIGKSICLQNKFKIKMLRQFKMDPLSSTLEKKGS